MQICLKKLIYESLKIFLKKQQSLCKFFNYFKNKKLIFFHS